MLPVRTKPQAPRSLHRWLSSRFVCGLGCWAQEVHTGCDTPAQDDARRTRKRRNYTDATIRHYLRFVEEFSHNTSASHPTSLAWIICGATRLTCSSNEKLSPGSVENHRISALRFFFVRTLHRHEFRQFLPYPKARRKLPKILSREEVARLIDASSSLFERTLLMVLYGTGMRRAEIARLKIADIDSQRMIIHVVNGKGGKDRDLPLSPTLLETLRAHWRWLKPQTYLFPSRLHRDCEQPITDKIVWRVCTEAAKRAGIRKPTGFPRT